VKLDLSAIGLHFRQKEQVGNSSFIAADAEITAGAERVDADVSIHEHCVMAVGIG
jgi:hypothetical protein